MDKKRKFCVAPMMGYTTPHARKLYRLLSNNAFLFTEMIASKTMVHSLNRDQIIKNDIENSIALQVGGSDINELANCAKIAKSYNYEEINLNVGCPSKKVQNGSFGVCLMKNKNLVKNCLDSMLHAADIEVTVKCRIGIGREFNYDFFYTFIDEITKSGIKIIYVHARNAILTNFSPKNNRTIPPLNYEFVKKIKNEFPKIQFILNGGIDSIEKANNLTKLHDGIMVGRLIQNNPFSLINVDKIFYDEKKENILYQKIIYDYFQYVRTQINNDSIFRLLSPLINIFFGFSNNKKFKTNIQSIMKKKQIDTLENLFFEFLKNKNYAN